jgi:Na+-transporting NADH:ubiquinone oxidoreductase subunit NqrB
MQTGKGWRTLALNILLAIAPILQATGAADLGLTGNAAQIYAIITAALNFGMRFMTTTPVGQK